MLTGAVIDSDAFLAMHSLGLLPVMVRALAKGFASSLTSWVAEHELTSLQREISLLKGQGTLALNALIKGTAEFKTFRQYLKDYRADKGECECIAWLVEKEPRSVAFVSCDKQARKFAKEEKRIELELAELIAEWVIRDVLTKEEAEQILSPWASNRTGQGRPADYEGFEKVLSAWRQRRERLGL